MTCLAAVAAVVRLRVGLVGGVAGGEGGGQDLTEAGAAHLHAVVQTLLYTTENTQPQIKL